MDDLVVPVHFDDAAIAALGHHGQAVGEPLKGVDLDRPLVAVLGFGLVLPDDLLVGAISTMVVGLVVKRTLPLGSRAMS